MEKINWLIKMVIRYKECCDEEVLNNIIRAFEPKIKYYIGVKGTSLEDADKRLEQLEKNI